MSEPNRPAPTDPTVPYMTLDIVNTVLGLADDLPRLAEALTDRLRELTGARLVAMVQCLGEDDRHEHRLLCCNPDRRIEQCRSDAFDRLIDEMHDLDEVALVDPEKETSAATDCLARLQVGGSLLVPLVGGGRRVGALVALGLPSDDGLDILRDPINLLAGTVALVVHNAYLIERQDRVIRERTEKLRASRQRLKLIAESVPSYILELAPDGTILFINRSRRGEDPDEIVGKSIFDRYAPKHHPTLHEAITRVMTTGEIVTFEDEVELYEIGNLVMSIKAAPVIRDGEVTSVVLVADDVTEQRRMQEQLRQAQKLESIGQLAGGVAHDFNNQLAGIMGYADILETRVGDPATTRYVESIRACARRGADLTQQLLAFARQGKYETVAVDVNEVVHDVVDMLKRSIDKRIVLQVDDPAEGAVVRGDPTQLQNAVLNLALNARDAMPEGGTLRFGVSVEELAEPMADSDNMPPGEYVMLEVTDTGAGMDEHTLGRIFEPFFTTKPQGKGTGMGLAAVYGTVVNHRGTIHARSRPGHGTTMTVVLPRATSAEPSEDGRDETPSGGTGHVLVVDDEKMVRDLAREALETLGYHVTTCADGQEAVQLFGRLHDEVDVVALDMMMPRLSGREAFEAFRNIRADVPVVLLSGYAMDEATRELTRLEGVEFLQKPFRIADLGASIQRVLGHSRESSD